jgi:simple sugar transport system permease protein
VVKSRLIWPIGALLALVLINFISRPTFLRITVQDGQFYGSIIDILRNSAPLMLVALGMCLVIGTRGIDLSVGAQMAISGAVALTIIADSPTPDSLGTVVVAILAGVGITFLLGLWNGFLVSFVGIQPIIATLVLMVAGRGIAQLITEGAILTFNDDGLTFFGSGSMALLPMPVVIWLLVGLLVILLVRRTALGMLIEAVGINRRASTLSGIQTPVLLMAVYMLSGLCASIAGIIVAADIKGADANNAGLWLELDAILAVVVGGNSLLGGRFSILGSLIGAMIIQAVNTGILSSGFPPEFNLIIKAVIIIVILVIQSPAVQSLAIFASRRQGGREQPK